MHEIEQLRNSFAKVIRSRRLRKGWSHEEMAARSGLERSYVSRLEKAIRTPSLDVIFRFAEAFNITPPKLVKEVKDAMEESGR